MPPDELKLILQRDADHPQKFSITKPETILGREAEADIVIDAPGVSRRHARILHQGEAYFLEDLDSSNGTFLNGERINRRSRLGPGDEFRLGKAVSLVCEAPESLKATQPFDSNSPQAPLAATAIEPEANEQAETRVAAAASADRHVIETEIGEEVPALSEEPPRLDVLVAGEPAFSVRLQAARLTLGRADDNDIVIPSKLVSRYHARLERQPGGYHLVVLPEAKNPVLYEGRPLNGPHPLQHGDIMRIGSLDPGLMVTLRYDQPSHSRASGVRTINFGAKTLLQIGRDRENDVVLEAPTISRFHAQIERTGQRYRVRDLRSSNGTFVNDQRVEGEVWLKADDTLRIGPYRFVVGTDQIAQYDESGGLRVEATGLNKWVRKDLNILKDISLVCQPREFIVVVGQSGGGKSTLVDAIAGYRPATHGRVSVNGIDVYHNFDAIRHHIGFVPQKDIIHMELTVFQALDYAAQLRMPPDTSRAERHQRVMEVLEDLDLVHRKDVQISGLSGGQQKRVSIGVELLTKPGLFFLDEPSSGLDPGTETALMQLMRRLADQGRTIVLITHATKNVMLADKVVFLARGGYLAWFGPPDEALQYFNRYRSEHARRAGAMEFDEIYAILDDASMGQAEDWAQRYQADPAYERYIRAPLGLPGKAGTGAPSAPPKPSRAISPAKAMPAAPRQSGSALRQFFILSARNLKILTRDRFSLFLMLASAPVIGLLDVVLSAVMGRAPFDFMDGNFASVTTILFLLTVNGVMVGALAQMREFVKEADIYQRERLVNLKILPYVLSKVWVAGLLAFYQAGAYMLIRYLAFDMPGGTLEFLLIYVTLTLAIMAGMMLGLFASALSPNANAVPLIVILFIIPQVVLGGALIPLPEAISAPTSTRWGFEAQMAITGAGSDIAADACWSLPEELRDTMSLEDKEAYGCNCMGLSVLRQESCNFPSLGMFYDPAIDEPPPVAPDELGDPPPEPVLPPAPPEPANQSDPVALADYLSALDQYQAQVKAIQDEYKSALEVYQGQADIYRAQAISYQSTLAEHEIARNAAVGKAEGLLNTFQKDMAWTFVDKNDAGAYWGKLIKTWLAQGTIIAVLLLGILVLMWRKDRAR